MDEMFLKKKTWISSAHQGYVAGGMRSNTLSAFYLAAQKGADMIETDARTTRDGVLVCNHDPDVRGFDGEGRPAVYRVSETDSGIITRVVLAPDDPAGVQYVPTLKEALELCYYTGMRINIDLKEGMFSAEAAARLTVGSGMRGRAVYATNGAGAEAIKAILAIDPEAKFIDTVRNYTKENLASVPGYGAKCYAYTGDFSQETVNAVRESGCMLAAISLNADNAEEAFRHHPDMAEYPHTSDFAEIDRRIMLNARV